MILRVDLVHKFALALAGKLPVAPRGTCDSKRHPGTLSVAQYGPASDIVIERAIESEIRGLIQVATDASGFDNTL